MSRSRITKEQAIEQYGSLEKYELHLAQVAKWHRDHADEQREYRWKHRDRERARSIAWRKAHPEQIEQIKDRHKKRRLTDKEFAERLNLRTRSRCLADKLGIDRKGCELHHFTDPLTLGNFIVLEKEKHRWLHSVFGGRNANVDLLQIKKVLPMLGNVVLVMNGEVKKWDEV